MIDDPFYENYGRSLAERHAAIAHTESDPSYIFVEDMGSPVEVQSLLSSGAINEERTILVWENPLEDIDDGGRDNYHARWKGSLAVLHKATGREQIRAVRRDTRRILFSLLALMLVDAADGVLEQESIGVDVRGLPLEPVGPVGANWYGYGLEINWIVPISLELNPDDLLPPVPPDPIFEPEPPAPAPPISQD